MRRIAKQRLYARAPEMQQLRSAEEIQKLVHELEVHQIELEIQNEELCQARDELETLLGKYTDIYDFAPVGYFILDRDSAIRSANLTGASLLGIDRPQLIGRSFKLFVLDENRAIFSAFLEKVFTSNADVACETTLTRGGVTQLTVQIEALADSTGQQCRIAVIDITERRQAEAALNESKERMYKLAELAINAIVMLDENGAITFCNAAAERMFDFQSSELIGRNIHRLLIPERFSDAAIRGFANFREHGTGPVIDTTTEIAAIRKDGTEFPVEISISAVKLKGKWHSIGIMRDITERKNLENQLLQAQKMETVGLLSGGIAHDFNNILNVIIGYVFILENNIPESDPLLDNVKQISAAADRAANITKSLLNFSRKNLIHSQPTDINEIIRNVDKFLTMVIGEDIRLETACGEQALMVTADIG
ncbi:MAG: PAS domain S-box protein, partial [Geobacteraceae bacterium]|nr:PAS domain S-box protein [Geobacteraceae bacterium]